MNKKVLIAGGNSSILGIKIKETLSSKQHDVVVTSRDQAEKYFFEIGKEPIFDLVEFEWLIIVAWKQEPRTENTNLQNISSIKKLIHIAERDNCQIIFISTLGVLGNTNSFHVRAKNEIESLLPDNSIIIRPGSIVNGEGNLVGEVSKSANFFDLPLVSINPQILVALVSIETVTSSISVILSDKTKANNTTAVNLIDTIVPIPAPKPNFSLPVGSEFITISLRVLSRLNIDFFLNLRDKWEALSGIQSFLWSIHLEGKGMGKGMGKGKGK